jgi:hypothetical protein
VHYAYNKQKRIQIFLYFLAPMVRPSDLPLPLGALLQTVEK